MSESHARQMRLFRENSGSYMSHYSDMFKKGFLEVLRRRGRNRVKANVVYQEYIKDRHHIHMNSTQWTTLSSFIIYLSKKGMCEADQTEKGWFVKWKDTDPDRLARRQAAERMDKMKMTAEAVAEKQIEDQVKRAYELANEKGEAKSEGDKKELKRDEKRELAFGLASKKIEKPIVKVGGTALFDQAASSSGKKNKKRKKEVKKSAMELLMEEQEKEKKRKLEKLATPKEIRKENWLFKDLIVKILNRKVGNGAYYKKKARVLKIRNKFEGEVKLLESGAVLRIDQEHLETVIPGVGRPVLVVNGAYRGYEAKMVSLDDDPKADQPTVTVKIMAGDYKGKVVKGVELEDVCKLAG
eukprot:CAMPEP_0184494780 /NCGR_PEP_ID=MMETSP0113_2-20130426/29567_1 /TAXON_ID=91329 /ORGANISM="Norrisiella sphaerica, Strain BC52" /LENGTH=354 /DNA_ID=CAMNT_0026880673 /DNA_START=175 /DNA_END=1239 /DNA_ORIENTATION=+